MADELLTAFRFEVQLRWSARGVLGSAAPQQQGLAPGSSTGEALCDGGFQEVNGLEIEMDISDIVEGGRNNTVYRRLGRGKFPPLVLKRGLLIGSNGQVRPALLELDAGRPRWRAAAAPRGRHGARAQRRRHPCAPPGPSSAACP